MDSVSENSLSTVMMFLHELESFGSVSFVMPSTYNNSVGFKSGNSSHIVISINSEMHNVRASEAGKASQNTQGT